LHEYAKALAMTEKLASALPSDMLNIVEKLLYHPSCEENQNHSGVIDKLCFYCEALVQTSKIGEHLLDAIDELRNAFSKFRTAIARQLRSIHSNASFSTDELLRTLKQRLYAFFELLVPVLTTCSESETALFTLLELRKTFNHHLGENTVENLLQQIFPDGPHLLRQALVSGYSRRGFDDFCQRHETLFEGLVWPCSPKNCNLLR